MGTEVYLNCHYHGTVGEIGPWNFETQLTDASIFDLNRELKKGLKTRKVYYLFIL